MMKLYSLGLWSVFVAAGISPHIIFLTAGELGTPKNSQIQPDEMAQIREAEARSALQFLNASMTLLSFPDLQLPFVPFEELVAAVLPIIRELKTDALFSFHPYETTQEFDHPDHNVAGMVAKYVAASADVEHLLPEKPALEKRPELYLWTTDSRMANSTLQLKKKTRKNRNQYLEQQYPSQFSASNSNQWSDIFDKITRKKKKHTEQYYRVR